MSGELLRLWIEGPVWGAQSGHWAVTQSSTLVSTSLIYVPPQPNIAVQTDFIKDPALQNCLELADCTRHLVMSRDWNHPKESYGW